MWTFIILTVVTYILLNTLKYIEIDAVNSNLFGDTYSKKYKRELKLLLSVFWVLTLPLIIILTFKSKKMKALLWTVIPILLLIYVGNNATKYYNLALDSELSFNKKIDERLTTIDNITKVLHNKLQVAGINDSSYYKNLYIIATGRVDKEGLAMKWIQENNPNINYGEVSALYKDLSASVESYRGSLVSVETQLQSIVAQYDKLRLAWPSGVYLFYKKKLNYIPISTSANKIINSTGVDNEINL